VRGDLKVTAAGEFSEVWEMEKISRKPLPRKKLSRP
jgi:hypothetical protein